MKERIVGMCVAFSITLLLVLAMHGAGSAAAFRSPSLNGATGLIYTPTAHTGWDGAAFGFDAGVAYTTADRDTWIPHGNIQLFNRWEIGAGYEFQRRDDDNDFYLHTKLRFFPWSGSSNTALAIGGNYQSREEYDEHRDNFQVYLAATYGADFLGMPSETTLVFGYTGGDDRNHWGRHNSDVDFSMGFDLDFIPSLFKGYVHMMCEFSNYAYTMDPEIDRSLRRGAFNSGIRIAALKALQDIKLNFDVLFLDLLDDEREFAGAVTFGMAF